MLPLVSHAKYAPRALLRLEKRRDRQTDGRTDGRQTVTLRLPLDAVSVMNSSLCLLLAIWGDIEFCPILKNSDTFCHAVAENYDTCRQLIHCAYEKVSKTPTQAASYPEREENL